MKTFSAHSKLAEHRSIYCVGKNYPDHAREMATWETSKPEPLHEEEPIIFMKPGTALSPDGHTSIPQFEGRPVSASLHYEGELVLLVGADADCVELADAPALISGYAAGLDMTLRDVQLEAKKAGNPWLKCKGFRQSALVSEFISPDSAGAWEELAVSLRLNGDRKQHSKVSEMSFSPAYLVHYLSYIYGLRSGDLIFTGTPAGVGSVRPGDRLDVSLETAGVNSQPVSLVSLQATVS
ncbi:FAA hydrolase family protein [Chlorobaculum sp. 24CR]|uniref:fumarylacetoacetate hydrolase family protein n=1 Tax=Chlorobaculum sp. 24CR TaxID=2508878 RepID=UPI00100A836B|nr:fumarylacetoacetate hydrolase family protein [Chlorobaculum sp. 24CR]RXK85173.1 FAA hydrolase family protein [Chlorobaculum sp. 24CR]